MKLLYPLIILLLSCSTEPESLEMKLYKNNYIYHGFGGVKKCHEWNNDPSSSFFNNSQYTVLNDTTCIDYCNNYLSNIQSGWSNYSCYDCSVSNPVLYKNNGQEVYQDSTFSIEFIVAYCQLTMNE